MKKQQESDNRKISPFGVFGIVAGVVTSFAVWWMYSPMVSEYLAQSGKPGSLIYLPLLVPPVLGGVVGNLAWSKLWPFRKAYQFVAGFIALIFSATFWSTMILMVILPVLILCVVFLVFWT